MNVEALKALYVALGGALTDTYADIAGGVPVSEYSLICDVISAIAEVAGGGEQGGIETKIVDFRQEDDTHLSGDITYGELYGYYQSGNAVVARLITDSVDFAAFQPVIITSVGRNTNMVSCTVAIYADSTLRYSTYSGSGAEDVSITLDKYT